MAKGGHWEREIARELTEWMTGERNPPQLWRSTQSGGWEHRKVADVGDLAPNGEIGARFRQSVAVEVKSRRKKAFSFRRVFTQGEPRVLKWWRKISSEATDHGLFPWLIVKVNYIPTLVGLPLGVFSGLGTRSIIVDEPGSPPVRFIKMDELFELPYENAISQLERLRDAYYPGGGG